MAGAHPTEFTLPNQPCSGLEVSDQDIPLRLVNGVYQKTVDDSRVDAKLITVQRPDSGKTPNRCTVQPIGIINFKMPDSVTLAVTDKGKGIKGAANGGLKLVAYAADVAPAADAISATPTDAEITAAIAAAAKYDPDLNGRVLDISNATGNKWIEVLMS